MSEEKAKVTKAVSEWDAVEAFLGDLNTAPPYDVTLELTAADGRKLNMPVIVTYVELQSPYDPETPLTVEAWQEARLGYVNLQLKSSGKVAVTPAP